MAVLYFLFSVSVRFFWSVWNRWVQKTDVSEQSISESWNLRTKDKAYGRAGSFGVVADQLGRWYGSLYSGWCFHDDCKTGRYVVSSDGIPVYCFVDTDTAYCTDFNEECAKESCWFICGRNWHCCLPVYWLRMYCFTVSLLILLTVPAWYMHFYVHIWHCFRACISYKIRIWKQWSNSHIT